MSPWKPASNHQEKGGLILNLQHLLTEQNLIKQEDIDDMVKEADRVIKDAVDFAEAGTWEPAADITKFVYSENSKP